MKQPGTDQSPEISELDSEARVDAGLDDVKADPDLSDTATTDDDQSTVAEVAGDPGDGPSLGEEPEPEPALGSEAPVVSPDQDPAGGADEQDTPDTGQPDREAGRARGARLTTLLAGVGRLGTAIRTKAVRRRRILLVAIGALAVLLLAASAVLYFVVVRPAQQTEQARVDGLAAARSAVEQVLTYQPASQGPDLERARSLVTGDFGNQFDMVLDTVVRPALEGGVGTRTVVTRAGVVSADTDRVTALLYLTQEASRGDETPRTNAGRAEVTVQRVDGRWLVSDLRNF
ncbi:hypothetical protein AD006_31705 (plasmid) [Pseudonocardia sp. EC080610-09]|uniref:hypothetical protein n=1 Tax=unclassified Pseudonocardia TaxID=2619320 RepID=UPI000706712C|nr:MULTISPECIES: hypothetical protein [unclassified Pseudonocardia]ALL79715.1 hypothetical protein AD006_31705 [Pseudonocardia sp. EC080610-09]ALL85685.1 hypothetical protein AD017_32080 [Pseudonocardia sp. EC080619-01]